MKKKLNFFLKEVYINLTKNLLMAFAAITTIGILLIIVGLFLLLMLNINQINKIISQQLQISVYLKKQATNIDALNLQTKIEHLQGVKSVEYIPKDVALKRLKESLKRDFSLKGIIKNPLPDTLIIKLKAAKYIPKLVKIIKKYKLVEDVNYWQKYTTQIIKLSKALRKIGFIIILILFFSTLFIINNTIRLTIYARRREIRVMQLVGANIWFIRWPFILEGMLYGFLGGLISIIVLSIMYNSFINNITKILPFIPIVKSSMQLFPVYLLIIIIGIIMGAIGSFLSLNKYLNV